jgi:hypothetical protein
MKDLRRAAEAATHGTVRLRVDIDPEQNVYAVRVPTPGLRNAGFSAGSWLVLTPASRAHLGGDSWLVVLKARGTFGATGANWTIAHVKELTGDEGTPSRIQLSYGSATGREFRPERLDRSELTLAARVVCHADEVS